MSSVIFGGALLQLPIGHLSDRSDRRLVLVGVTVAGAGAALGIYILQDSLAAMLAASVLFGGCLFTLYSLAVAHTNDHLEPDDMLDSARGLLLLNGVGASLGPIIAGVTTTTLGNDGLIVYLVVLMALLALYTLSRHRTGLHIPTEAQGEFVAMTRTSTAALELDPRLEQAPPAPGASLNDTH